MQRPAAAFKMALNCCTCTFAQTTVRLKSVFYYSVDQWRNCGPAGPQLREDPGKGPERGPFSSHIVRDGDWGPIF